jgi:hypothetical protein
MVLWYVIHLKAKISSVFKCKLYDTFFSLFVDLNKGPNVTPLGWNVSDHSDNFLL